MRVPPSLCYIWADKGGYLQSYPRGSETLDMTSEGLGEMFEGDSADMCAGKFPLMSMVARAECLVCADPGARNPIAASGNLIILAFSTTRTAYQFEANCQLWEIILKVIEEKEYKKLDQLKKKRLRSSHIWANWPSNQLEPKFATKMKKNSQVDFLKLPLKQE